MKFGNVHIFGHDYAIGLALDPEAYRRWAIKRGHDDVSFCREGSHGRTRMIDTSDGRTLFVVTITDERSKCASIETASLLVHEAVHVFQRICRDVGEDEPSEELEAYGIHAITLELFDLYCKLEGK